MADETTNTTSGEQKPPQKKMMMAILAFIIPWGIHRYLMGYKNWWLQLVLAIFCVVGIFWSYYDAIMILTGKMKMADGRDLEA